MFDLGTRPETPVPHDTPGAPDNGTTVAALLTAPGRSAIATIMVHGPNALTAVAALCHVRRPDLARITASGRLWIGHWHGAEGEPIVVHVVSPHCVEINCHGGLVPSQTILHDLAHSGIPTMPWRALAERNRLSPIETESLDALTRAQTLRTASILLDQAQGALASRVQDMLRRLGEGELAEVATNLCQLLQYSELGLHLVAPWRVAIVGRPNVGKSSLLNAMVGYHRALVHPTAGTTRDLVTATTAIDGWPVEFADCAGIRLASDELEAAGVARARLAIAQSDRQLVVFDASEAITDNDEAILHLCPNPLVVANKSDLPAAWNPTQSTGRVFATSALRGAGIADLLIHLATFLVPNVPPKGEAVPFTARQLELLNRAQQLLQDRDVSAATECLHRLLAVPAITEFPRPADLAYLASADG